jgi:microcystin-dependent protein
MSQQFLGSILMVGFNFAPYGWALCDGQILPISQNAALFSLLGTQFGGNGTSTFALPNLQGRVPIGQGTGPGLGAFDIGELSGSETIEILSSQLPSHTHTAGCNSSAAPSTNKTSPSGAVPGPIRSGEYGIYQAASNGAMAATTIGPVGSSNPVSVIQPTACVNFIIAMTGVFPERS